MNTQIKSVAIGVIFVKDAFGNKVDVPLKVQKQQVLK